MAELGRHRLLDRQEMEVSVETDGPGFYDCPEERDLKFVVRHHTQRRISLWGYAAHSLEVTTKSKIKK